MCEQCLINPLYYGEVVRGLFLIRARRESDATAVGQWGLVQVNNPDFVWTTTPVALGEDEELPQDFVDALEGFMMFDSACSYLIPMLEAGFSPKTEEGQLFLGSQASEWLWNRIAEHIKTATPTSDPDPFPHLDDVRKHDYTL